MVSYVIGVDIGTMGTKTGIYDDRGNLRGTAYEESVLYYPKPGQVEQKHDEIYRSAVRTHPGGARRWQRHPERRRSYRL
jgi:xylulokinase